jgi:hypothetical protein
MLDYDNLFKTIEELVLHHSPSGVEEEIDRFLLDRFKTLGRETWQGRAGNIVSMPSLLLRSALYHPNIPSKMEKRPYYFLKMAMEFTTNF